MDESRESVSIETLLRHRAWVRRLALSMARDEATADDLAQETWIAAMRKPPRSESAIRAWLRRVMRNRMLHMARTESRLEKREQAAARADGTDPTDEVVARAEAQRSLVNQVFDLAEPYRTTMILRYFEELSAGEVAQRLGVPANTVRVREKRALEQLRGRLDRQFGNRGAWCALLGVGLPKLATAGVGTTVMALTSKQTLGLGAAVFVLLLAGLVYLTRDDGGERGSDRASREHSRSTTAADGSASERATTNGKRAAIEGVLRVGSGSASLSGDVRYAATDTPAADCSVTLGLPDGERVKLTTNAAGYFRFEGLTSGGPYAVAATATRCATARTAGMVLADRESLHLDTIWLDAPLTARVLVIDPKGAPVSGARVDLFAARRRAAGQDWKGNPPRPVANAVSAKSGVATFDDLAPGRWTFRASHPNFASVGVTAVPLLRGGVEREIKLVLQNGHALRGRIIDVDQKPLANATVLALAPREATASMAPAAIDPLRFETTTDEGGNYEFTALPRGGHSIAVVPAGGLACRIAVIEVPAVSVFNIDLDGGMLSGKVTDSASGAPIAGAEVRGAFWRRHHPTYLTALTDAEGSYEIRVPLGAYLNPPARGQGDGRSRPVNFEVRKDGYVMVPSTDRMRWSSAFVLNGAHLTWDLAMRRGATIEGSVRGPEGPVAGARVRIELWNPFRGQLTRETVTDGAGHYAIAGILDGRALIRVDKPGYYQEPAAATDWLSNEAPPAEVSVTVPMTGTVRLDAMLKRGAVLEGRVETESGSPVTGADVTASWPGAAPVATATDASGAFRLASVRTGAITLRVARDGMEGETRELTVTDEQESITIRLPAAARVAGRVTTRAGDAPNGAFVQIAAARTVLEGSYEVASIWQKVPKLAVEPDGTFAAELPWFDGTGTDGYLVRAVAPGFAPRVTDTLRIAPGEIKSDVRIVLERGHTLKGLVVNADGSGPVAGARIEFSNDRLPPALGQKRDWSGSGFNSHPFEIVATTGADGKFAVHDLPAYTYRMRVTAPGFGWGQPTARVPGDGELRVELRKQASINGRVVFEDGTPAASVLLRAHPPKSNATAGQATTDADGRFEMGIGGGAFELEVRPDWRFPVDVLPMRTKKVYSAGGADVEIQVSRGRGTIAGRAVAYGGEGVPGAFIHYRPAAGGPVLTTRADAHGVFRLVGLSADAYQVRGVANRSLGGPEHFRKPIIVEAGPLQTGSEGVVLEFQPALTITGRVSGPSAGSVVHATTANQLYPAKAPVAADGSFRIVNIAPGTYALTLADGRSGKALPLTNDTKVQGGATDVELRVAQSGAIAGDVVDASGKPVPGVVVFALDKDRNVITSTRSDMRGSYRLTGLSSDAHSVEARHEKLGRAVQGNVPRGSDGLRLKLAPQPALSLRLVNSSGAPLRAATVRLTGSVRGQLRTDADGRLVTRSLPDGTYRVELLAVENKTLPKPVLLGEVRSGSPEATLRYAP